MQKQNTQPIAPLTHCKACGKMRAVTSTLGIIAGNRNFPLIFAHCARKAGVQKLIAVAFENETDPSLEALVDEMVWLKVGQLNKMIEAFEKRQVKEAVMVGQIAPKNLFRDIRPDLRALSMLMRLKQKNAATIFGAIADEMAKDGITLVASAPYMKEHLPPAGLLTKRKLSEEQDADASYGFEIAKAVSALDIGQTVAVKNGTVVAVEAFEGTDEAIRRAGNLAGEGVTVAKVSKPNQDLRFDMPVVGLKTIQTLVDAKAQTLVIEAEKTMLLEKDEILQLAADHKIHIVAKA